MLQFRIRYISINTYSNSCGSGSVTDGVSCSVISGVWNSWWRWMTRTVGHCYVSWLTPSTVMCSVFVPWCRVLTSQSTVKVCAVLSHFYTCVSKAFADCWSAPNKWSIIGLLWILYYLFLCCLVLSHLLQQWRILSVIFFIKLQNTLNVYLDVMKWLEFCLPLSKSWSKFGLNES